MEEKKYSKAGTFFFGFFACILYLVIQGIIGAIGMIPLALQARAEVGSDIAAYTERYMELVSESSSVSTWTTIATVVCFVVVFIWYMCGYYKKNKAIRTSGEAPKFFTLRNIAFVVTASVVIFAITVVLQRLLESSATNTAEFLDSALNSIVGGNGYFGFIFAIFVAPLAEELLVRGVIVGKLSKAYGIIGTAIISAILFGFLHLNIIQGIYVLPMGIFWGWLAYKYKSVVPSMICHILNNFLGTIGYALITNTAARIIIVGVCLAAVVLLVVTGRKNTVSENAVEKVEEVKTEEQSL